MMLNAWHRDSVRVRYMQIAPHDLAAVRVAFAHVICGVGPKKETLRFPPANHGLTRYPESGRQRGRDDSSRTSPSRGDRYPRRENRGSTVTQNVGSPVAISMEPYGLSLQ